MLKRGNSYISKNTLILNMGTASHCPSKIQKLCKHPSICYAWHSELQYDVAYQYRMKQAEYWLNTPEYHILLDIKEILRKNNLQNKIKYLRINESGDFYTQECVSILYCVAKELYYEFGIKTYGFTARSDLDFSLYKNSKFIFIKGSNWEGPNGSTYIYFNNTDKKCLKRCITVANKMPVECKGKCGSKCFVCMSKTSETIVIFKKHGNGVSKCNYFNYLNLP